MSKYIDADELIMNIRNHKVYDSDNGWDKYDDGLDTAIEEITDMPTADVAEIKRSGAELFIDYPDYEGVKTITLRHKGYGCSFVEENTDRELHYGRWEELYENNYKCSVCGSWWTCEETPIESGMSYCPNCGASMMDEVEDGLNR